MPNALPPDHASAGHGSRDILSVSQLNRKAKMLLETHLPLIWVEGEISNFARPSSGHWYFTLKDAKAQVRCAMFRNANQRVRFAPGQGQQVLIRARVSLYEGRGEFQLIAEHMEEAGFGALQRAFEELKARLDQEGLFDQSRKRPLPGLPQHIGVITSPTGAAIRDILSVLERRFAGIPVTLMPVAVQGAEAAPQIVRALANANHCGLFDVLIVGRGGGSLEDLWPFNEESVARAIYASQLPVISAVGHEVDFTIADFVADARAPTPSAAAEMVSPDGEEMLQNFAYFEVVLEEAMLRRLHQAGQKVEWLRSRLRHPGERLQAQSQHLDNLEMRLRNRIALVLQQRHNQLHQLAARQARFHPQDKLAQLQTRLQHLHAQLLERTRHQLTVNRQRLTNAMQLLDAVSPLNTLERGYAIVADREGHVLRKAEEKLVGQDVTARLGEGALLCRVEKVQP